MPSNRSSGGAPNYRGNGGAPVVIDIGNLPQDAQQFINLIMEGFFGTSDAIESSPQNQRVQTGPQTSFMQGTLGEPQPGLPPGFPPELRWMIPSRPGPSMVRPPRPQGRQSQGTQQDQETPEDTRSQGTQDATEENSEEHTEENSREYATDDTEGHTQEDVTESKEIEEESEDAGDDALDDALEQTEEEALASITRGIRPARTHSRPQSSRRPGSSRPASRRKLERQRRSMLQRISAIFRRS